MCLVVAICRIMSTLHTPNPQIEIILEQDDKKVTLSIKDNGAGFQNQEIYFGKSTKSNLSRGIFLATIKSYLEQNYNGSLMITSSKNTTKVKIEIPKSSLLQINENIPLKQLSKISLNTELSRQFEYDEFGQPIIYTIKDKNNGNHKAKISFDYEIFAKENENYEVLITGYLRESLGFPALANQAQSTSPVLISFFTINKSGIIQDVTEIRNEILQKNGIANFINQKIKDIARVFTKAHRQSLNIINLPTIEALCTVLLKYGRYFPENKIIKNHFRIYDKIYNLKTGKINKKMVEGYVGKNLVPANDFEENLRRSFIHRLAQSLEELEKYGINKSALLEIQNTPIIKLYKKMGAENIRVIFSQKINTKYNKIFNSIEIHAQLVFTKIEIEKNGYNSLIDQAI